MIDFRKDEKRKVLDRMSDEEITSYLDERNSEDRQLLARLYAKRAKQVKLVEATDVEIKVVELRLGISCAPVSSPVSIPSNGAIKRGRKALPIDDIVELAVKTAPGGEFEMPDIIKAVTDVLPPEQNMSVSSIRGKLKSIFDRWEQEGWLKIEKVEGIVAYQYTVMDQKVSTEPTTDSKGEGADKTSHWL